MNDFKLRPTQRSEGSKQHAPALCKALCRKPATKISGNLYALLQMCRKNLTRHVETVYVCAAIRNLWLIYVRTYQVLEGSPKEWQCLIIFEGDGVVWEPWPIIKRNSPFLTLWLSFSSKWYSVGMLFAVTLWTLSLSLSHLVSSYLQVSIWNFLFFFFFLVCETGFSRLSSCLSLLRAGITGIFYYHHYTQISGNGFFVCWSVGWLIALVWCGFCCLFETECSHIPSASAS